jgi:pristinamycin I synthase-3/4
LESGRLKSAGAEELTQAEQEYVRAHKAEIIAHLLPRVQSVPGRDDTGSADGGGAAGETDAATAPLSYQQERLWLLHEIAERSEEYNSVSVFKIHGSFDPERFLTALRRLVADNDVLRTVFRMHGDTVHQVVLDAEPWFRHTRVQSAQESYDTARSLEQAEADHQFDLRNEVPVRCRLISGPDESHYIVLNIHHIACDGWSISLILDRLSEYYGAPDVAPAPARTYRDYARWQRGILTGDVLESQVNQWVEHLTGAPLLHSLPADFSREHAVRREADGVRHRVGGAAYSAFRKLCLAEETTEFAGLHAVLGILLARITGQEETVVGSPIANREQQDIHSTVGFFVNMISVRGEVRAESTFRDVLAVKKAETEFGYAFQQAPFEKVVERLVGQRHKNTTPVFQVVLVLQNNRVVQPQFGTAVAEELPEAHRHSRFELEIFVHGSGDQDREIEWVYNRRLFERATIERWAAWFAELLEEVTEHPDLPSEDLRALASGVVPPTVTTPQDERPGLLRRIEEVAAADPERVAVSDGVRTETYAALLECGRRIGAALRERHGNDAVFAISMDRSLEMVRTLVGVMSIGATYVALDQDDTSRRRGAVLAASNARCLLVAEDLAQAAAQADEAGLDVLDVRTLTSVDSALPDLADPAADRDLYYVFTSGSTGSPKGVRVTYGNLAAYLGGVVPRLGLADGAVYCWQSSVATDFGNTVLFGALATGGRLEIALRDDILDGVAMSAFLRDRRIDVLKITPSHLEALLESHPIGELLPRKKLVLGGEAASEAVVRALREVPASVEVFNHYGPSETTVGVFVAALDDHADQRVFAIGHPLPGIEFTVETDRGEAVPFGVAGELVLRGPQVAAGYLAQPGGTSGPFGVSSGRPTYRTGDQVRQRNDGQVVFLGRRDSQVKIRGHRVELGEIKAALESAPGVARGEVLITRAEGEPSAVVAFVQRDDTDIASVPADASDQAATVDHWREFYDYAYSERVTGDIEFNTSGWISSYTGEQIPEVQMRDWLASTIDRISALRPGNVLEIGCGLGIIAYPLSRSVRTYLACDFSGQIIAANQRNAQQISTGDLSFFECEALDIDQHSERIRAAGVDTVVINSVVQYFPDTAYLEAVLEKVLAIDCVRHVFVGDVRNYDLLDEFSLSLVDSRAAGAPQPRPSLERLRLARAESDNVSELLVSDLYWSEFARTRAAVAGVAVLPRISEHSNELLDFRYDVILTKDPSTLATSTGAHREGELAGFEELLGELTAGSADMITVHGLPNPRTAAHCDNLRAIRSGVAGAAGDHAAGADDAAHDDLARILRLAKTAGLQASAHYTRDDHGYVSRLAVNVFRGGASGIADSRSSGDAAPGRRRPLVNAPVAGSTEGTWTERVAEEVARVLPRHMCPDRIVEVPVFPLNKTGKIDHQALRTLIPRHAEAEALGELVGDDERTLARILSGLLAPGTRVDRESDFFALGGHSLLATKYVHAVNQAFGLKLRVKSVFDRPRLRDFAELVAAGPEPSAEPAGPVTALDGALPISPLQQRFWTLAKTFGPSTLYNSLMLLELTGPLSAGALRTAFRDVVEHHRVLRARFHADGDSVTLRIRDTEQYALAQLELPGLDLAGAERILHDRLNRPFDLESGPLLDAALITTAPQRHFLAMAVHHAIFDGTSEELLVAGLEAAYEARLDGRAPQWDEDGEGFLRHLAAVGRPTAENLDFWVRHLADAPALHDLPLDHERPERLSTHEGAAVHSVLTPEATALLAELARRHRTTMFVVLNAVVALFTSFLSGEDDIVIGSPVDCRESVDDGRAVGMYVNTVAFRHRLDWNGPLDDLITGARDFFRGAVAHMAVPFDLIVEELNPPRVPGVNPVFQIMLALQPEGSETFPFQACEGRSIKAATTESKFDLTLNSKVVDGQLHVFWEYSRALFAAERIERTAALFESFVRTAASSPQLPLSAHHFAQDPAGAPVALLTGPKVPLEDESYLDAFARHAAGRGERPALRTPQGDEWDYRRLDRCSDALAALLRDKGVRPGDLVALTLERSAETLATVLAVNKLGAAYVPMDSEYLRQSAPALMAEHGIRFAVVEDRDAGRDFGQAVTVTRAQIPGDGPAAGFTAAEVSGTDLCYVIFTSGSTGRPKGVAISHRSVVNYLAHCSATYLGLEPGEAVVSSPLSFDATVTTTLFGLAAGLTLRLIGEGGELSGLRRELAPGAGPRKLFKLTPSHLVALSNLGAVEEVRDDRHTFVLGGEDLRAAVIAPWYRALPGSSFFNEYGPTEATVGCIVHQVTAADTLQGSVRIGTPVCNTEIAVLARGSVCVPDQRGEIVILGEGLARGYLDGAQTQAAFRAVPALDGAVGYHSGDLASLSGAGLRYHGRSTREIKVRGFRISLPEIEAVISGVADVADCACDVSPDGRSLRAYVVPVSSVPRTREAEAALRDTIRRRLPSYMVPDSLSLLAELPLTSNGKVDLARLGRETQEAESTGLPAAAATGSVARRLQTIWQEVLGASGELPVDVSFFSLGGNSLSTTYLLRNINEEFGAELSLETLYRETTLAQQAVLLQAGEGATRAPGGTATTGSEASEEVELTSAQSRIYLLEKLGSGSDYVNPICFRIPAGADFAHLGRAVQALLDRHPVLKSRVVERDEHLVLLPGTEVDSAEYVAAVQPCDSAAQAEQRMQDARETAVNVFGGPLFRAFRHVLPDGSGHLQMVVHHIVFDGWSERILLDDLAALYERIAQGRPLTQGPHAVPFQQYALQRLPDASEAGTRWWIDTLSGAPAVHNLPVLGGGDREQPATSVHRVLGSTDMAALDETCRALGITPFNLVHTALALAVCNMSYEDDVVIGVPTANRGDTRYHGTVGLLMETLPLRTTIGGGDITFEELVRANRKTVIDALGHTEFRIEEILKACAPHRDGSRNPLYQIMLSFNDEGGESFLLDGLEAGRMLLPTGAAKLDLIIDAKIIDGVLNLFWEYDAGLFAEAVITSLISHFEDWLRWGTANPQRRIKEFALPTPAEPEVPAAVRPLSAYERFVTAWEGRWTEIAFAEGGLRQPADALHRQVLALADRLVAQGVGHKSVVACLSSQAAHHVVTFLACSRLGAVYVPVDGANPAERTTDVLAQCNVDVMVAAAADAVPGVPLVAPDGPAVDVSVRPARPANPRATSHILFTSGSTGRPKGVRISNAALDSYVRAVTDAYGCSGAPVAQCANVTFDIFIEELALSVLSGNRLAVPTAQHKADPAAFARFVEQERIGLITLATSYWAFLVTSMEDGDFERLRGLRTCVIGGEDYPSAAAARWFEHFAESPALINSYGPTENNPVSLFTRLRPDSAPSTLGAPLGEAVCEVRSRFGSAVPVEGRGELMLRGPQLFSGYVNGAAVDEYLTGDVVSVDREHGFRFVERSGSMMKISGFRVEPGEYTNLIEDIPGVEDVRVVANPERTGVVIYVLLNGVVEAEQEITETVGRRLHGSLPPYLRGYELRFCRAIPLTANGKVDFRALRASSWSAPEPVRATDSETTGPRAGVRELWQEVLATNRLDEYRGFFDHGGTSMNMLRLLTLLNRRFPNSFELIDLYEKPSIDLQTRHIQERTRAAEDTPRAELTARERLALKRKARRVTGSEK